MTFNDTNLPIHAIQQMQVSSYVHVANAALLTLDWFLLLDKEVKYTWGGPWTIGNCLFFLIRYGAFVDAGLFLYQYLSPTPSFHTCFHLFEAIGALLIFGMIVVEGTMTLRVWAMWGKDNKVGGFLFASFGLCGVLATFFFVMSLKNYNGIDNSSKVVTGCFQTGIPRLLAGSLGAMIFHQTLIFFMTLLKCIRNSVGTSSFIRIFYLQGVVYYVLLQVLSAVNITAVIIGLGVEYLTLILSIQRVIQSVLCVRMLLHIREISEMHTIDTWTPVPSAASLFDLP
ncbi:hypothetical protein BDZ94DRAFT_1320360 [Collybia nuda]|uniref:DUF6533 domain-containing protein n=1 Tax=Collybia nuda TaxID=64659 RepID=A0A9P6CGP1_9AGAR|nr:hypothetical protein BDZ94DRAFT_1320360 [Collybia nuda]